MNGWGNMEVAREFYLVLVRGIVFEAVFYCFKLSRGWCSRGVTRNTTPTFPTVSAEIPIPKKEIGTSIHFAFCILHLSVLIATCTKKISAPENTNTQTPTIPTLIIAQVRSGQVSTSSSAHLPHLYREIIFTYRRQPRPRYGRSQKKYLMIRAPIGFIILKREGASSFSPLAERILSILF